MSDGARFIKVLDHGFIRLVDHMGDDLSIVRAARVSYDAAWRAGEDAGSDARLIRYLWKNRHTSPFEAVEFQFEVYAPIFVFRQWHRHRTQSYSELSGRYRELPSVFFLPEPSTIGEQASTNKQGRQESTTDRSADLAAVQAHCEAGFILYDRLLRNGWPRELARVHLGLNTYSHMFAKVDLRNLLHFLDLRCAPHAQYEIRAYADAIVELIRPIVPVAIAAALGET